MSTSVRIPFNLLKMMVLPSWPRNLRLGPEALEAVKFATELRSLTLENRLTCVWFHVPNEGKRSKLQGFMLKAMGLLPGTPDFVFLTASKSYAIELKIKNGKQTDMQRLFEGWCGSLGVPYTVCFSKEEAIACLLSWGLIRR